MSAPQLKPASLVARYGKDAPYQKGKVKPGPFYGTGMTYLDKIPGWWKPSMIDMSPADRFRHAWAYTRSRHYRSR